MQDYIGRDDISVGCHMQRTSDGGSFVHVPMPTSLDWLADCQGAGVLFSSTSSYSARPSKYFEALDAAGAIPEGIDDVLCISSALPLKELPLADDVTLLCALSNPGADAPRAVFSHGDFFVDYVKAPKTQGSSTKIEFLPVKKPSLTKEKLEEIGVKQTAKLLVSRQAYFLAWLLGAGSTRQQIVPPKLSAEYISRKELANAVNRVAGRELLTSDDVRGAEESFLKSQIHLYTHLEAIEKEEPDLYRKAVMVRDLSKMMLTFLETDQKRLAEAGAFDGADTGSEDDRTPIDINWEDKIAELLDKGMRECACAYIDKGINMPDLLRGMASPDHYTSSLADFMNKYSILG